MNGTARHGRPGRALGRPPTSLRPIRLFYRAHARAKKAQRSRGTEGQTSRSVGQVEVGRVEDGQIEVGEVEDGHVEDGQVEAALTQARVKRTAPAAA